MGGAQHGFLRYLFRHSGKLEEDAARLDNSDPLFRRPFAAAHPYLDGLLAQPFIGKDADPHLPAAANVVRHGASSCLYLPVVDPSAFQRLEREVAKGNRRTTVGFAAPVAPVHLAVLCPSGHQHNRLYLLASLSIGATAGRVALPSGVLTASSSLGAL